MSRELLTQKQYEVAVRVAKGYFNHDIAKEFRIEITTVETHLSTIFKKLGIKNRTQLSRLFFKDFSVHQRKPRSHASKKKFDDLCIYPMLAKELREKANCSYCTAYKELRKRGLLIKAGAVIVYQEKV